MKSILDDASIDIPCSCGKKTAQTVGWLKRHDNFACPGCGATIRLDRDQLLAEVRKAEKGIDGLAKSLRRLG